MYFYKSSYTLINTKLQNRNTLSSRTDTSELNVPHSHWLKSGRMTLKEYMFNSAVAGQRATWILMLLHYNGALPLWFISKS